MVAVTEAYTTITTTTFEDNTSSGSDCYQRIMGQEMLSHCGMYLMKNVQGGGSQMMPRGEEEDHMQLCCMQLRNVGKDCMCEGLKMMMNQMPAMMKGQMMSMAQKLPTQCNLSSQPCQMRAVWF
ncbi:hypothetical protein QVD17_05854 [Tagetes erecta]|uniref:Bifunctional inhibitor/plant lipid transfer protein/seed storage helical domain-containing protein n=1 Tax=Tagetes erecta TaxID=13708 RepID=A0AAD8PBF6_TARER|nr:hypothetical protein QVD17_05854 [Tagetes erecta]